MKAEFEDFDPGILDRAIQNFEELENESKAVIITAIKLQIESHSPCLKELINHHYNAIRYSKNAETFLRLLKEKLT